MLPKQLDDFVQLFVVAVAINKDLKLRVASFGFPGLYVDEVDVVFLQETLRIRFLVVSFLCIVRLKRLSDILTGLSSAAADAAS